MQFQRNKLGFNEFSYNNKENSNSKSGEMAYMEPLGNQILSPSPISLGNERSIDSVDKKIKNNKQVPNRLSKQSPTIIQSVKNDLKNKIDIEELVEENPIPSIIVKMPYDNIDYNREKSPRYIRYSQGGNVYNKTTNHKHIQKQKIDNNYQVSTDPHMIDSHNNIFFNSSNDSGRSKQIILDPRVIDVSKSPQYYPQLNEHQYFGNDRRERGGIIPFNKMSPNLNNFEEMNNSSELFDSNKNQIRKEKKLIINNNLDKKNIQYINQNNINDEINNIYKNQMNQNVSYHDIKKIMKKFTKIYDPLKNSNGILIESSQVIVPGASDDIFRNRYKVLSKMKRLSNILLSKRKRSINKYQENINLNLRSRSRTKSRSPFSIKSTERSKSGSPIMKKMSNNKFLYVSLAMIANKGPKAEDRIILRKMRLDKGGVVDLAQEERKKAKYKIKKIMKNKTNKNLYYTNPKYREIAAKIIQEWWKELKISYSKKLKKIILIQSVYRGKWVRKNMYDLLYLNYLYICFCRKIEKVLSNNVRPYVLDKLFLYKKAERDHLKNLIYQKEKRDNLQSLSYCWKKWYSIIKNHNLRNKLGKQLIDIRSHKENKLNILLAFFNKWRYLTKISNIPPGKNINIYPLYKINGLCKIMDAAKKYIQKKALRKIIKQLIKYLSNQLRNNLLTKIISKKSSYIKNISRNILYLWYSKILKFRKVSNEEEAEKLRQMRRKIFRIMVLNVKRRLNERILRKYFIRLYHNTHPGTINKYILYEILRKINVEELKENKENIVNIKGKKYKIIKTKKDLKIIRIEDEDSSEKEEQIEDNEQIVEDYEKIVDKIHKRKSGEFKEGEEIPEDIKKDLDNIDKKKKKSIKKSKIEKKSDEEDKPKKRKSTKKEYSRKRKEDLSHSSEQEEEEIYEKEPKRIKYIKPKRHYSERRDIPYEYIIKKRKSSPQRTKIIKRIITKEESTPSQSDEYEEIEDSPKERKIKKKINIRRRSEPIKNIRYYPKRRIYDDYEEISEDSYEDKRKKKYIYIEEKPQKKKYRNKRRNIYEDEEEEDSPYKKKRKTKYIYIKKDSDGNEYIDEEIFSSGEEQKKRKSKVKTKEKSYIKRRSSDKRREEEYDEERETKKFGDKRRKDYEYNNKIDEVEENEESEDEGYEKEKRRKKKYDVNKIDVYDKDGKKLNNLKKYKNDDGEYMIDLYDKQGNIIHDLKKYIKEEKEKYKKYIKELYDEEGRHLIDLDKKENKIDLFDKNGKKINDLKKYKNKEGDLEIPIYDKDGNEVIDSNKYKNEDGEFVIDLYDQNGKKINDLKKYEKKQADSEEEEEEEEEEESYDKQRKKLLYLKKYEKEYEKIPIKLYDKNGKKINNLKKYINKEGDITIPIYNKDGDRIIDLDKEQNKIDIYDKNRRKINNLRKYKNEDGDYDIDIYDENGSKIIDLKKYKKEEIPKEIYDKEGNRLLDLEKYEKKEDKDTNIFDKNGNIIKNLRRYTNKEGEITIPIYDKDNRQIKDLKKYKRESIDRNLYDKEGKIITDLKKYEKKVKEEEEEESEESLENIYDEDGKIIKDLKKYENKEGEINEPIYDKDNRKILDLQKYKNEDGDINIDIYDKKGNKINNIKKYKNENGDYNIDIYDKNGNRLLDLKKYKKEPVEDNQPEVIRYITKEGEYSTDVYDKNGKKITNLSKYKTEDGQYTIPIFDAHRNSILTLERQTPKTNEYEQVKISRYNINPKDENKDLTKLSQQGEIYIPSHAKKTSPVKIKPITLIGHKTELGKLLEKYNFLRKYNFSLKNLSEKDKDKQFEPKTALLLDIINDKEQKLKLFLWKYFCIWRGNAINKYNELGDMLKFIRGASLTNLRSDFIETLKSVKNPRLYSIALKKFLMNLFHKNIDLLRDAFNHWKKVVQKENMNLLKSKFFYSLCKKNDKKNKEEEDGVTDAINNINNLRKRKIMNLIGPYPDEVKNILSLYFQKWKNGNNKVNTKYFFGNKTVSLPDTMKKLVFKKDKISESFIQVLLSNIPEKDKDEEMKKWIKHPLRRMIVLRYRRERMNILRFLLRWYNKVRLILAIEHLEKIVQGREKLTKLMRFKPSKILYKKMKLMNPKFYKSKGEKLVKVLLNITKRNPFEKLINNMKLFNRVNKLRNIQPKIHEKISKFILKKYTEKWNQIVEKLKEQKIKLLLIYVKKKIKDEKIINQNRKNELLKRFIINIEKNKINKLLLAFRVWQKLAEYERTKKPLVHEKEGNLITMFNGEEKIIGGKDIREGGEINIKLKKNKEGEFTIDDIINNNLTEKERQEIIQKKIPATIYLIDDKIKSLLQMKLYKWKSITNKIVCDRNARTIQRFVRKKLGNLLWKKRVKFFDELSKKYLKQKINKIAKTNRLAKVLKKLIYKKFFDNLKNNAKNKNSLIALNENFLNINHDLKNKNKNIALKNIIKLYMYVIIKKLFENFKKLEREKSKVIFKEFINKLKQNVIKKAEFTYENKISNENIPFRKKLSFSIKKSSSKNIPKKDIDKSIPYISLLPHLMKFLDEKIKERNNYAFNDLKKYYKSQKLNSLLTKFINNKLIPVKNHFYINFTKLATNGEKQKELFKLLRKYIIKKLFKNNEELSRLFHLLLLIKLSIVNKEISNQRWIRAIIRKWRFLSFSRNVSKKKMSLLYKNFHINYLEMVKDVFGEEKMDNPSVIKEFERFGANVGMWENERPGYNEESKFCKKIQKKLSFKGPKEWDEKKIKVKTIVEKKEEQKIEEIKEVKKEDEKEELKEKIEDSEKNKDKEQPKGRRRYFRKNLNPK